MHPLWHAKECLGNTTRDAGNGVAVATYRDGVAHGILKVACLEGASDGLWHAALAGAAVDHAVEPLP